MATLYTISTTAAFEQCCTRLFGISFFCTTTDVRGVLSQRSLALVDNFTTSSFAERMHRLHIHLRLMRAREALVPSDRSDLSMGRGGFHGEKLIAWHIFQMPLIYILVLFEIRWQTSGRAHSQSEFAVLVIASRTRREQIINNAGCSSAYHGPLFRQGFLSPKYRLGMPQRRSHL